jgi:tetratricopeptide (TPR) repeat protein
MNRALRISWAGILAVTVLCGCSDPQSRKALYMEHGRAFFAAANYEKARLEFRNAAQIDPNDADTRLMLGQVAEKLGDARGALGDYGAAISINPRATAARAAMARLYLLGGMPHKALELVAPELTADPTNAQLLTVRGAANAQLGDSTAALADAQAAMRQAPDDLYAIALLASVYRSQSRFDEAIAVVDKALSRFPDNADLHSLLADLLMADHQPQKAQMQLRRLIQLEPGVLARRYRLAGFYLQQNDGAAAVETLREAVSSRPESVDAKLQLVKLISSQHGLDQASSQIERYLAAEPINDPLRLTLGEFLAQNGRSVTAEQLFREVIAHGGIDADGLAARDRLAALLIVRKDMAGAADLISQVLKESAGDNDALLLRSNISLAQSDVQAAITDLRAVLRDQPNSVPVMRTLAEAYRQNEEPDLAEQTLRTALQMAPKDFESSMQLAQILISAGKQDQAQPLLVQLAADNPGSVQVKEVLFQLQLAQKDYAAALLTAQNIQLVAPARALGLYLVGMVQELQLRDEEAEKSYKQALELQPEAGEPLAALVRLDLNRKQFSAAAARVDAVIARSADNAVARRLKGEMLMTEGQPEAAILSYQEALRIVPTWDLAYHDLALAQIAAKRYGDALTTLQTGILKSQASTLLVGDLGRLYEVLGRSEDAIALYEGLLAKHRSSSFAVNNLAMLLVTYRQDAASLARAQQLAQQLSPHSEASALDTRGWVRLKSGDSRGAELLLRQAVNQQPAQPELRYHLGMAQLRSGEWLPAQENLEAALKSDRPFIGRGEAKAALAQLRGTSPLS